MSADAIEGGYEEANPYVALCDLLVVVLLVVVLLLALGRLGLADDRYRKIQASFSSAVNEIPEDVRPSLEQGKNDPPGAQRWVFAGKSLFVRSENGQPVVTRSGRAALDAFAKVLGRFKGKWRRIRIEGHTLPKGSSGQPQDGESDDWELSSSRAAIVAREVQNSGNIPAYFISVSGRAGQNPLCKVLVYGEAYDQETTNVRRYLVEHGVAVSTISPTSDPQRLELLPVAERQNYPKTLVLTNDMVGAVIQGFNERALYQQAVEAFPLNDRVEIVMEYNKEDTPDGK